MLYEVITNIPIGLIGIALATRYVENLRADRPDPFDLRGFLLAGTGIAGLLAACRALGGGWSPAAPRSDRGDRHRPGVPHRRRP